MSDDQLLRLLDCSDEYILANEALIRALRQGFFALAQFRYSRRYTQAPHALEADSTVRFTVERQSSTAVAFKILEAKGDESADQCGRIDPGATQSGNKDPESPAIPPKDGVMEATLREGRQASTYSSIVSELAEKYGCSDEIQSMSGGPGDDVLSRADLTKRAGLPPRLKKVCENFEDALNAVLKAASAKSTLQLLLKEAA